VHGHRGVFRRWVAGREVHVAPHLVCRICSVEIILSDEPTVRMAEVATFYAAHRDHDEGLSVDVQFRPDETETG
jgi:hypothetical protein